MIAAERQRQPVADGRGQGFLYPLVVLLAPALLGAAAEDAVPPKAVASTEVSVLAAGCLSGATINSIKIENGNVFDLGDPEEDRALYRLANKLHIKTRPSVIRQQLLFQTGDPVSLREIEESERILRSNHYIRDAKIEPVARDDGGVDVNVRTADVWTLVPRISLSRAGGKNRSGIGLKETNLLGKGVQLEALFKSNVDRNSAIFKFANHNLGSSWYSVDGVYVDSSDGRTYGLDFGKPFYALNTTSAFGLSFLNNEQVDALYDRGDILAEFVNHSASYETFRGWSSGLSHGWTKRYRLGLAYDDHEFSEATSSTAPMTVVPQDRKLVYPFVGIEFVQDKYEKTENVEQINRTEDRHLGTRLDARLGLARPSFGSDRNAWILDVAAQTGFGSSENRSLILASTVATRIEDDGLQNVLIGASAKFYSRQSERRLFYVSFSGTYGHNLDIDNQVLLGGDSGLRGYPLRYQTGDRNVLLTLEQRYFTDWYPFRLFRIGGAMFFDAGRTWGRNSVSDGNNDLLRDIGFGLRIGSPRSGSGRMTHVDLAFPLDGDQSIKNVQLLVEAKSGF